MSAPRIWEHPLWIPAFALGLVLAVANWALSGSTLAAFGAGSNGAFLMWAILDHLDAKFERLRTEVRR